MKHQLFHQCSHTDRGIRNLLIGSAIINVQRVIKQGGAGRETHIVHIAFQFPIVFGLEQRVWQPGDFFLCVMLIQRCIYDVACSNFVVVLCASSLMVAPDIMRASSSVRAFLSSGTMVVSTCFVPALAMNK